MQTKFHGRNLKDTTIRECLNEHKVNFCCNEGLAQMCLIEVSVDGRLSNDFLKVFPDSDSFNQSLANLILNENVSQKYGVLVDSDLRYRFAFNRALADFDFTKGEVVFKNPQQVLTDAIKRLDLMVSKSNSTKELPRVVRGDSPECDADIFDSPVLDNTKMLYALVGKDGERVEGDKIDISKLDIPMQIGKSSLLKIIHDDYAKSKILIRNNAGDENPFFLINTSYETSSLADFLRTYQGGLNELSEKLAEYSFSLKEENRYGLLFSEDLQIQFAFNTKFGRYNSQEKTINFLSPEAVLLNRISEQKDLRTILDKHQKPQKPSFRHNKTLMRYALQGKKS